MTCRLNKRHCNWLEKTLAFKISKKYRNNWVYQLRQLGDGVLEGLMGERKVEEKSLIK